MRTVFSTTLLLMMLLTAGCGGCGGGERDKNKLKDIPKITTSE